MAKTTVPNISSTGYTQFGNTRQLDPSASIFVFKTTFSDYEELSDNEVNI
jgi:hypothetical protein